MRKRLFVILLFVFLCMVFTVAEGDNITVSSSFNLRSASLTVTHPKLYFKLPSALQNIEEGAFEGTAAEHIILPESLEIIGDRAFAKNSRLRSIYIPNSTKTIGKDVIAGTHAVMIAGMPDSYAKAWAKENGIPFSPMMAFMPGNEKVQMTGILSRKASPEQSAGRDKTEVPKYSDNNGRNNGEIKAAKHEECFAFSIQGRAPPMM